MRSYIVTGAASGIGKATKELLEERGHFFFFKQKTAYEI